MGLKVHKSEEDLKEYQADPVTFEAKQSIKPKKKQETGPSFTLNQNHLIIVGVIILAIILLKMDFSMGSVQRFTPRSEESNRISGTVISKFFDHGAMRIILDDPYHSTQYHLTMAPDIVDLKSILPGSKLSVKAQQIGPNDYVINSERDIRELTQVVDYQVLNNVQILNGVAHFQSGEFTRSLVLNDMPDGSYSQLVILVDSNQHVNVVRSVK